MHVRNTKGTRRASAARQVASSIAVLAALFAAVSCGDTGLVTVPGGDNPDHQGEGYKLTIKSPVPLTMETLAVADATVELTQNGAAVSDAAVSFAVLGTSGGTRLSSLRATTDADGLATIQVIAGSGAAQFRIVIETQFTNPVEYSVTVNEPDIPPASLRVQVTYPDQTIQPVRYVEIGVYASTVSCDAVKLDTLPQPIVAVQNLTDITKDAVFEGLQGGTQVTILARGFNDAAVAAYGCTTGVALTAGEEAQANVDLTKRTLDVTGTYDYQTSYDMGNAIPGTVGDVIGTLADIFDSPDDPGLYLVQLFEDQVGSFGSFESVAVDLVNSLIDKYVPEKFRKMMTWVGDAAQVVKNLTFDGTLTIAADDQGNLTATEKWVDVIFTWRGACDPAANPGCQLRPIALRNTHIHELTFTYPVTQDGLVLRIPAHDRVIPYARFFHLFLLQIVYPELVPGATSTGDVLKGTVDCAQLAQNIATSDDADDNDPTSYTIAGFKLSVDQMTGWCNSGLGAAGTFVDSKLDALAGDVPSTATIEGAAEIKDTDRNLVCEELANGSWQGAIVVDGTNNDVMGVFSAKRQ